MPTSTYSHSSPLCCYLPHADASFPTSVSADQSAQCVSSLSSPLASAPPALCAGISMTAGVLWLTIMDVIGSAIYFLDLWMGFQLGIIARWEGRVVIVQSERRWLGPCSAE